MFQFVEFVVHLTRIWHTNLKHSDLSHFGEDFENIRRFS